MGLTPEQSLRRAKSAPRSLQLSRHRIPTTRPVLRRVFRLVLLVGGIGIFVLALQLLKHGAEVYGHVVMQWLHMSGSLDALGFGWLLSYIFLSGSPVAAMAVSLFASGSISDVQTFTMITGSRLGASFMVLLTGFIYSLRGYHQGTSIATGILTLLTTMAIYLPALLPGYWLLSSGVLQSWRIEAASPLVSWLDYASAPMIQLLARWLPGWALLLCGVGVLLAAFSLIDRALPDVTPQHWSFAHLTRITSHPLALFALGGIITSMTLSVSVSIAVLVPLSARGIIQPRHMLPYVMGANITTFIDTLIAALVVGGPAAFTIVLVEMISVAILSLLVLLFCYRRFERVILQVQAWIARDSGTLAVFLGSMLLLPLLLLLL
jgi:Na+/phosphate symporter